MLFFGEHLSTKYDISEMRNFYDDEMIANNIGDDYDTYDIVGIDDAPLFVPADEFNLFLLNDIDRKYHSNVAYFEPSVDDLYIN